MNPQSLYFLLINVAVLIRGYLSGKNDSLRIPTDQTCPPNKTYCGHDPEAQAIELDIHRQRQKLLITCGDGGRIADVGFCDHNCTSIGDMAGHALCQCSPNMHYCGHELSALGGWMDYESHILYLCLEDGISASIIHRCSNQCIATGKDSVCSRWCVPNDSYCGDILLEMGLTGYDPKTVYQCDGSGQYAVKLADCSEECLQGDTGAFCQCHPGRTYCLHELITQMNWPIEINNKNIQTSPNQIAECKPNKHSIKVVASCIKCIASQGEKDAYCQWTDGIYCGRKLNKIGWPGHENDTLYQCGEESGNVSIISMCHTDTCIDDNCGCIPMKTYCGRQLSLMGYSFSTQDPLSSLWQCNKDKRTTKFISYCKSCTNSEGHARCACTGSDLHCGNELDADPPYDDKAIYRCNDEGRASLIRICQRQCLRLIGAANLIPGVPVCMGECIPGEVYCGSKLLALGFTGYNNDSIYTCSTDGLNISDTGRLDSLCSQCTHGQSYCAHQLRHIQPIAEKKLQTRYVCQNGAYEDTFQCSTCINKDTRAYCQCSPGSLLCGRVADSTGLLNTISNLPANFTNDTLFRCDEDDMVAIVEHCPKDECQTRTGDSYCLCTPGRTYCDYQLDTQYNSPRTFLSSNTIYQCSNNKLWVDPVKECVTCVSVNGIPQCRQQCIRGSRYCGSDLLGLEGWGNEGIDSDVLYQCINGSFATQDMNCTQRCNPRNGDVEAYCLGMPIAWYWILTAVTLPLLFISLCLGFIRTIIKHRRLQKFVQQHRINASQLTLVRKLGHGQFGEVWHSKYTQQITNGQQMDVAVKISKHHLNTNDGQNLASANCFFQESVALDFLRHQNITRAIGICSNLKMAGGITTPALVLEYMDGGNSADYILKERDHLQTSDLMRIFTHICQAGEHLQKMGVIHRDIGARNVLIRKHPRNGKPAVAKLTDFGLAKDIGKAALYRSTNSDRAMFHQGYTAPEGFTGEFSSQSDVWSFGVFMWELYMLMDKNHTEPLAPYSDIPSQDILKEIVNGYRLRRPLKAPTDIYSTMTSCWSWMPESRPAFRQLRKSLQVKRTREVEPQRPAYVPDSGHQEEETEFWQQNAPNGGYGRPT